MLFLTLGWVLYLVLNGYSLILLSGQEPLGLPTLCSQCHECKVTLASRIFISLTQGWKSVCVVCACQYPSLWDTVWEAGGVCFQSAQEEKALKRRSLTS